MNPYDAPQSSGEQHFDSGRITLGRALLIVAGCGVAGLLLGVVGGGLLGVTVPDYFRALFGRDREELNPVAIGLGLGGTQGFIGGIVMGLVLVVIFCWYDLRLRALAITRLKS